MDINQVITIQEAIDRYLNSVKIARSNHTYHSYRTGLTFFLQVLKDNQIFPEKSLIKDLSEDTILLAIKSLQNHTPATERLYITAIHGFFEFLVADRLAEVNISRIQLLIKQRSRKPGIRLPQFPRDLIEDLVEKAISSIDMLPKDEIEKLRVFRDRSFIITLCDTGLRVHEACNLRRGDIDWNEGKAIIIGKGNKEAVIRFSKRTLRALREYLSVRSVLDGSAGKPLASLPLFSRHDRGAGNKVKPITPTTGRNIISEWYKKLNVGDSAGVITPHSFRHYFVTKILQSSGNLKLAQELARHQNIAITQRYAHLADDELDRGYIDAIEGDSG